MADCQEDFMSMEMGGKIYLDSFLSRVEAMQFTGMIQL